MNVKEKQMKQIRYNTCMYLHPSPKVLNAVHWGPSFLSRIPGLLHRLQQEWGSFLAKYNTDAVGCYIEKIFWVLYSWHF